jgi:Lrp/AsnC family transcriptional regulator, leucine-responsive regulatory protein
VDRIDSSILYELARDGRQTNAELADRVGLSQSATLRRVRQLEDTGVIVGYTAVLDPEKVGRGTLILVRASLDRTDRTTVERFREAIRQRPEVVFVALLLSKPDVIMHVRVGTMAEYEALYLDHLSTMPGLVGLESQLVIDIITEMAPAPAH